MYEDKVIQCAACGEGFVWTAGEQAFFADKGFSSPPKSCRANRQARKTQREHGAFEQNGYAVRPERCPYDEGVSSTGTHASRSYSGVTVRRRPAAEQVEITSGIVLTGRVARVLRDRMFGFVRDEQGVEYYFHQTAVDDDFFALSEGSRVSFITESSPRGPRAVGVSRVD
jgi:cold shock CspA family protein